MAMVLRVEAKGGEGGYEWDDGFDYDDVTKIHVQSDLKGIQSIKFEYVKAGKTIVGSNHGVSGDGSTNTFEINPSEKELLVAVNGYYDESTGVIQSIQFTTNRKTSELMGFKKGTKFSLRSTRRKIIGFHGFADKNINSVGAYFVRVLIKSELVGGHATGSAYDDGVYDYDGIRKLYIAPDAIQIRYMKIDFDKAGRLESHERGDKITPIHEFEVDYPNEYITSVEGTYGNSDTYKYLVITSLFFKTSKGRHSPIFGRISGTRFLLESPGNVIVGFYGRKGSAIDGMGAYFTLPSAPLTTMALKVEAKGGKGGNEWDDGSDHEGVTKIQVRGGFEGIQFINFEYIKAGNKTVGPIHGGYARGLTQPFEINHSDGEYLVAVDGYYDESTGVIQSIQFTTNKKTSELMGFNDGTKFTLSSARRKIVGFHGFADKNLISLGAYFDTISIKSELMGGHTTGISYDDGGYNYDGIRKVYLATDGKQIRYLKIDYDKAGQLESHERGDKMAPIHEFEVDFPNEYITSVEGTYAVSEVYKCPVITSLSFKTSKPRSSPVVGRVIGTKFVLESPGHTVVGFYGRVGACIDSIRAYYAPPPTRSTPPEKLQGQGGDGGNSWDDGAFQNVKKIYVGQGENGIAAVKFVYGKDAGEVVNEHGKVTPLGYDPFELYPDEYITSVEGCYDKILGAESGIITMLKFKTNKRTSPSYGLESGSKFVLEKGGHKITGFHGKASTVIHQIGVHVVPTTE